MTTDAKARAALRAYRLGRERYEGLGGAYQVEHEDRDGHTVMFIAGYEAAEAERARLVAALTAIAELTKGDPDVQAGPMAIEAMARAALRGTDAAVEVVLGEQANAPKTV